MAGQGNIQDTVDIPAGGGVEYTVYATVDLNAYGIISNTADVSSGVFQDPDPSNNSATDDTTVIIETDLSITKTDNITSATPGQQIVYTI